MLYSIGMKEQHMKWVGLGLLVFMLVVFGILLVPAHMTSLWMDREFTDWISPIANRLHSSSRLYADGLHSPMPPLPFILMRLLFPGGSIWIHENLLNYLFQAATILSLYLIFAKRVGTGLAFAACMTAVPIFLAIKKAILYDSMAQFLVVICAESAVRALEAGSGSGSTSSSRQWVMATLTGMALGLVLLAKQSTGIGAFIGVCAVFSLLPATFDLKRRCLNLLVIVCVTAITVGVVSLALSSFMSFSGLIKDVFLTGSEPKGGTHQIFINLKNYARYLLMVIVRGVCIFYVLSAVLSLKFGWKSKVESLRKWLSFSTDAPNKKLSVQGAFLAAASLTAIVGALFLFRVATASNRGAWPSLTLYLNRPHNVIILNFGLVACMLIGGALMVSRLPKLRAMPAWLSGHRLAPYAAIFFCSAIFHSLSVFEFRWMYDNNPLIVVALIFLFSLLLGPFEVGTAAWRKMALLGISCGISAVMWCTLFPQVKTALRCTESWPEIPFLAGAKLRPECEGMRQLVKIVQSKADAGKGDAVLLLPDDPNVEAWFDRKRPALSSAIIFTDQYWDRYVDQDFASLQVAPPKVVVIGPRNSWRGFSKNWHPNKSEGVLRLIDLLQDKWLKENYDLQTQQRISYGNGEDFMDVYVRRAP